MSKLISRASFLRGLVASAAAGFAGIAGKLYWDTTRGRPDIPCRLLGPSMSAGHMIRNRLYASMPTPPVSRSEKVIIIGGGIAGLSAAWWLKKNGISDFILLELEKEVGGNSASGRNNISAYPWAAHYIPVANAESEYVRALFAELGVIESFDKHGQPIYNELHLCHDPQERLLKSGTFHEGLVPKRGLQPDDEQQSERFFDIIHKLRDTRGNDGKPVFAIPLELSSADEKYRALDEISMGEWMKREGFTSKPLRWYVDYCCKDDYGSTVETVSAWAGLHYFAGRRGSAANADINSVVTWPEGNGFVVNALRDRLKEHIISDAPVHRIARTTQAVDEPGSAKLVVSYLDRSKQHKAAQADYVIFAAPRFIAKYVIANAGESAAQARTLDLSDLAYAPWMVANISMKKPPEGNGLDLAWDNVRYASESLGYVVATHQNISTRRGPTVITYYQPMSSMDPLAARRELLAAQPQVWCKRIVDDLEKMHPGISSDIISIDLWPWGHGMIRPSVGYIWGETRRKMREPLGNVYFAHSDMSGISNFEEAQYRGVEAARDVLVAMGKA